MHETTQASGIMAMGRAPPHAQTVELGSRVLTHDIHKIRTKGVLALVPYRLSSLFERCGIRLGDLDACLFHLGSGGFVALGNHFALFEFPFLSSFGDDLLMLWRQLVPGIGCNG